MADFKGGVLTNLGKALGAKIEAGKCKLQFTKMNMQLSFGLKRCRQTADAV